MQKKFGTIASIYGALAVVLGAFGAHALKDKLDIYQHAIYDKAVSYQFYHAIALLVIALLAKNTSSKSLQFSGKCSSTCASRLDQGLPQSNVLGRL